MENTNNKNVFYTAYCELWNLLKAGTKLTDVPAEYKFLFSEEGNLRAVFAELAKIEARNPQEAGEAPVNIKVWKD